VDAAPPGFVDLGEGDTLKAFLMACTRMGPAPSAHSDKSHLEFFVESLGPDEARETNRACGCSGSTTHKITARQFPILLFGSFVLVFHISIP
jgi:hypothetical protein